jgi:hypothetical protein
MMISQKVFTLVKAGVQKIHNFRKHWIPAFAGVTGEGIYRLLAIPSIMTFSMDRLLGSMVCFHQYIGLDSTEALPVLEKVVSQKERTEKQECN